MKKKIVTMALSVVLGLSLFGGVAQAKTCDHSEAGANDIVVGVDPASGLFHVIVHQNVIQCPDCFMILEVGSTWNEIEDHVFNDIRDGRCYCSVCGMEDEFYH